MRTFRKIGIIMGMKFIGLALFFVLLIGLNNSLNWGYFMGGILYVIGISIIGICDTLSGGVEKRAKEQEVRSEKLKRDQAELQEIVWRQQQKMADDMKKRQAKL